MLTQPSLGTLTLIGSGEMSRSMGKVHRDVLSRISGSVRAVFLDTPAGFELNADDISARAVEYFQKRLQIDLQVASFKSAVMATPAQIENALSLLRTANYVFAGPGSPSYVVNNWRDTVIFEAIIRRFADDGHVVLASSAAIAMGRYALPVYEIYKVGQAPHWIEGLDLLGPYGYSVAIVPHWNNAEGGAFDTRYCFMGEARAKLLENLLPDSVKMLGIDEYTACILDPSKGEGQVMGAGQVTIRHKGSEVTYPDGSTFDLDQLKSSDVSGEQDESSLVSSYVHAMERTQELSYPLPSMWDTQAQAQADDAVGVESLIELLIEARAQLRDMGHWPLADEIRDKLFELGIVLEDGPTETTWRRA